MNTRSAAMRPRSSLMSGRARGCASEGSSALARVLTHLFEPLAGLPRSVGPDEVALHTAAGSCSGRVLIGTGPASPPRQLLGCDAFEAGLEVGKVSVGYREALPWQRRFCCWAT
jgi:hypothetical protein